MIQYNKKANIGPRETGTVSRGPIYHYSAQIISRGKGQSAVASAAYRAGAELVDERTGEVKNFTRKERVDFSEIAAPENAPDWVRNRQRLWNEVEAGEKRKDAQLCREVNAALPRSFTLEIQKRLVREFVKENYTKKGMITDWSIHDSEGSNPHVHMMITMREIGPGGFAKKKNRNWNKKEFLEQQREQWAKITNKELARVGIGYRIDHRSYEAQGIDAIPTKHLGPRPNIYRRAENAQIMQANAELAQLTRELKEIETRQKEIHGKAGEHQEQQLKRTPDPQKIQDKRAERAAEPIRDSTSAWPEHERERWRIKEIEIIRNNELRKLLEQQKEKSSTNLLISGHEDEEKRLEEAARQQRNIAESERQKFFGRLLGKDKRAERAAETFEKLAKLEKDQAKKLTMLRDKHAEEAVKSKLVVDLLAKEAFDQTVKKILQEREQKKAQNKEKAKRDQEKSMNLDRGLGI